MSAEQARMQPARLPTGEERQNLIIKVAKRYHALGDTQTAIARSLGLTRWQVSRLLADARDEGLVRVEILPRIGRDTDLEVRLQRKWGLVDAVVVPGDQESAFRAVGHAAALYLTSLRSSIDVLGVSWGRTMSVIATALPFMWRPGLQVVMLNGSTIVRPELANPPGVAEEIARTAGGTAIVLPVPAVVGRPETRDALESDPVIADILAMADSAPVACFGLGSMSELSVLPRSGYVDDDEFAQLTQANAVGDVLGRFIDISGTIVNRELDSRTVGLELQRLRDKRLSIGVAAGENKQGITRAALQAGFVNVLVTDSSVATELVGGRYDE